MRPIDILVVGTFPGGSDRFAADAMEDISKWMWDSVQLNFDLMGRPAWPALRNGVTETILVGTGKLRRSIYREFNGTQAIVGLPRSIRYGAVHNFGGTIMHPGSNKVQIFQIGGKWIKTTHTKPHNIRIPKREFMMFQDIDIPRYQERLGGSVFTLSEAI